MVDALISSGAAPSPQAASGSKVTTLMGRLAVNGRASLPAGPVLLVDDTYRSGWTMTVASFLLRSAGTSGVLPLVVHQQP